MGKDTKLPVESEKDLKAKLAAKENELQEKSERVKKQSIVPSVEVDTTYLSKAMYQVKLKDVELTQLKRRTRI